MITETIVGFASGCGVMALVYGPWQDTCTDIARQYCFAKRDELFDLARSGHVSFSSNEYRAMRGSLEKTIRYCHNLSIFKLLLFGYDRASHVNKLDRHISVLSRSAARVPDVTARRKLEELAEDVEMFLALIVFIRSPMLWIITPLIFVIISTLLIFSLTKSRLTRLIRSFGERAQLQAECA